MTNDLNSVLLEGQLSGDPQISSNSNGVEFCKFSIDVKRMYTVDDEIYKEIMSISIVSYSTLADNCMNHLEKSRGVRVVGRLKLHEIDGCKKLVILAEHVEFKPVRTS